MTLKREDHDFVYTVNDGCKLTVIRKSDGVRIAPPIHLDPQWRQFVDLDANRAEGILWARIVHELEKLPEDKRI